MIYKVTGGARIGKANATWPFASLIVDADKLILSTQILGYFIFHPSEIVSLQPVTGGIKIIHKVAEYKKDLIFLTTKNALKLISSIRDTEFLNGAPRDESSIEKIRLIREEKIGFPIKKNVKIGFIILWNLLFLLDFAKFFNSGLEGFPLGYGAITALTITFLSILLTIVSSDFRRSILADGWELQDIIKFLVFLMIIVGFILLSTVIISRIAFV